MINLNKKRFIPGIAWFFIVSVLLLLPGSDLPTPSPWFQFPYFDKFVHATLFAIQAFLFIWPARLITTDKPQLNKWLIAIVLANIEWGFITELLQLLVPGRSFDLTDWAADILGSFIAYFFARIFLLKNVS
ncbi:MAG: VanZ family protein [Ferruginibacter sp.]